MKISFLLAALTALATTSASAGSISVTNTFGSGASATGSLDIVETATATGGIYDVINRTNGSLFAFGVSNPLATSNAVLGVNKEDDACLANDIVAICYEATEIDRTKWNRNAAYFTLSGTEVTFRDAFGEFDDVAGDDVVFNWFTAFDGTLNSGEGVLNFFGFENSVVASNIIGIVATNSGVNAFTAGSAVISGGNNMTPVPLPATGLMLLAGLGGLSVMRKRKAT